MDFTEVDFQKVEKFCRDIAAIGDELEGHPSGLLRRSPENANLTRAIAYNMVLLRDSCRPVTVNPMLFATNILFTHRALYGGPIAALKGTNEAFYRAFFGTTSHSWPLGCSWEHTWHIIGSPELYPDLEFKPTRECCLLEDSNHHGTRAQGNRKRTKVMCVDSNLSLTREANSDVVEKGYESQDTFYYYSRLPSGHNATSYLEIVTTESTVDYRVSIWTDEGLEGIGSKKWKSAREVSTGELFAVILNKVEIVISNVRDEHTERSPVDIWFQKANGHEVAAQLTTIEPAHLYSSLARGERLQFSFCRDELIALVRAALNRKRSQSASGVHLILDCGFLIPSSDAFGTDVRTVLQEAPVNYESVWLVGRVDRSARCVFGSNPF